MGKTKSTTNWTSSETERALDRYEFDVEHPAPSLCDSSSIVCGDPMSEGEAIELASTYRTPYDCALYGRYL